MTIRYAQVKSICTGPELSLVEASRRPKLNKLSLAQARQHAQRARKHFDKWQGQARSQARTAGERGKMTTDAANRSSLKADIFREALANFEARVDRLEAAGGTGSGQPSPRESSKKRSAPQRAARAATRATLTDVKAMTNQPAQKARTGGGANARNTPVAAKKQAKVKTTTTTRSKPQAKDTKAAKPAKPAKVKQSPAAKAKQATGSATITKGPTVTPSRQKKAKSSAKQDRIDRSGLTSRVRGHVSARGKRAQGKRDSRG